MDKLTGAEIMVRSLREEGVDTVFGYPGAAIAPFYGALAREPAIRHILTRTEQGAGHAASGYGRMTGRPGVCVATSGPGATNLFTAIATAYGDSIPLVAITGQVNTWQLGRDVFQEVDTTGAVEPFTKYAYLVKSVEELGRAFKEAFHIASTGRRGPVLIDVPVDVQRELSVYSYPDQVSIRGYKPRREGHPLQVKRVAEAIEKARRPLLCCGGGVFLSGAKEQVRRFCEAASLPVVSTMMGVGALPHDHPLYFGMLGRTGCETANTAVAESDLLALIGARVGDRAITRPDSLPATATIVHIDIDTAEIGKNMDTTIPLVGDAACVLRQLDECAPRGEWNGWLEWLGKLRRQEQDKKPPEAERSGVNPAAVVSELCAGLPKGGVYVADVGQNQIWSARGFTADGIFLTTGGMGTMGYSIPAALGVKLARPEKTVLAVCGDGSFQMSMNELASMLQHGAPLKIVVMNNSRLGMIREIQEREEGAPFAVELDGSPDFRLIAQAYGVPYARVEADGQLPGAVKELYSGDGPYLLDCRVDPKEATI